MYIINQIIITLIKNALFVEGMLIVCMYRCIGHFPSLRLLHRLHCQQLGSSCLIHGIFSRRNLLHGSVGSLSCVYLPLGNYLQTSGKVCWVPVL